MRASGFLGSLLATMLALGGTQASAFTLNVFGDSLSDGGNLFALSGGLVPPTPPYAGVFSNGPVWVDQLADRMGLRTTNAYAAALGLDGLGGDITNFAVGGAYSGPQAFDFSGTVLPSANAVDQIAAAPLFPGLQGTPALLSATLSQVELFRTLSGGSASPDAWYAIWAGANDFIFADLLFPTATLSAVELALPAVDNIRDSIEQLALMGAQAFLVFNAPDVGATPFGLLSGRAAELTEASRVFNDALATMLEGLGPGLGLDITLLDVNALFRDLLLTAAVDPGASGFPAANAFPAPAPGLAFCVDDSDPVNRVDAFCAPAGSDPNDRIFWDSVHPSSAVHGLIAAAVATATAPVPAALWLLTVGWFGLAIAVRRRTG